MKLLISVSRSSRKTSPRQRFLSELMKRVSGQDGERLINLYSDSSEDAKAKFVQAMSELANVMVSK